LDYLGKHIEALIFCSSKPVKKEDLHATLVEMYEAEIPKQDIDSALENIKERYSSDEYAFEVVHSGGGFQFLTKPAYQSSIGIYLKQQSKRRLSTSALETLSIIAYKQPVTKAEIEQIRGVNCDYSVQKLLEKNLIEIKGKSHSVGRPLIYGTSEKFMDYFGVNELSELPAPKDFAGEDNEIGNEQDI
jgi:segregation and condensation protein B